VLTGAGVSDFPVVSWPPALPVAMWILAAASLITCAQRLHMVRTSPGATEPMPPPDDATDHAKPGPGNHGTSEP
jgi:CDP-diacylglycerol---glycerol-3-phosphate 3-phosphatidyltransferase